MRVRQWEILQSRLSSIRSDLNQVTTNDILDIRNNPDTKELAVRIFCEWR